jgi:hypothetical protein
MPASQILHPRLFAARPTRLLAQPVPYDPAAIVAAVHLLLFAAPRMTASGSTSSTVKQLA